MPSKQELRAQYRALRSQRLEQGDRALRSANLVSQLSELLARYPERRRLGAYMALPDEAELMPWLESLRQDGYELSLPRVEGEQMHFYRWDEGQELSQMGSFGIREPRGDALRVPPQSLELILIPGIAFDTRGYRLGRGKGYYDRYLPQTTALTIGITLDLMPLDRLPEDEWDRPMDLVLRPE